MEAIQENRSHSFASVRVRISHALIKIQHLQAFKIQIYRYSHFLHSQCFTAAFFILNIKNITLFYFICQTPCLCILHIALSPPISALVQIQLLAKEIKKHLKMFSGLIPRPKWTTIYANLTNTTNKQICHQLRCLSENIAE